MAMADGVPGKDTIGLLRGVIIVCMLNLIFAACREAYNIRLYAIREFGRLIHEFDPYFNYRATEYLYENGWKAFTRWFDHKSWYPLGRPVGTTIYPGMQVTAVFIKNFILKDWSINDICCYVPAWFGVTATLAVAWMAFEATRGNRTTVCFLRDVPLLKRFYSSYIEPSVAKTLDKWVEPIYGGKSALGLRLPSNYDGAKSGGSYPWWSPVCCAIAAAGMMSILPAHTMRSIGGGYDNEAVAMTAMCVTFAAWMTCLRDSSPNDKNALTKTALSGAMTGLSYFYMVASWGGYVFVLNLVGVHAAFLVVSGRYSTKLHRAYTTFYFVGTSLATTVPVVGWTPLKSLEQLGPLLVFAGMQVIEFCEELKRRKNLDSKAAWKLRLQVFSSCALCAVAAAYVLLPTGYFGPISSRVRGLFVKHTKTGNPLVDSVAEHQAASAGAYEQYLQHVWVIAPVGLASVLLNGWNDSSSFLLIYGLFGYYFSLRMVRLILLMAPIASVLGGIAVGRAISWTAVSPLLLWEDESSNNYEEQETEKSASEHTSGSELQDDVVKETKNGNRLLALGVRGIRLSLLGALVYYSAPLVTMFYNNCHQFAMHVSQSYPTIVQKFPANNGVTLVVKDYLETYQWVAQNTPEDARILAWWDYGYQINGIANRTTLADGNTWNHEHIALLGRILTGPEKESHRVARHLADYVLVWSGPGNDAMKAPHMRRIANSVYRGLCKEPTCSEFGFTNSGSATESMGESLVFKMVAHHKMEGVHPDFSLFKEVYKSKHDFAKVYKILDVDEDSKNWVEGNRLCDAPGSWYCPGQYPAALESILREKRDFAQLEDFNRGRGDEEYTKEYLENLNKKKESEPHRNLTPQQIKQINDQWENNELTTRLWEYISQNRISEMKALITSNPAAPHVRSEDGRGPMFWAHEYGRAQMVEMLKVLGVTENVKDANGVTPLDVSTIL